MPMTEKYPNCPKCKRSRVALFLYGYYDINKELREALDKSEIALGGCLVSDNDPKWKCNDCYHRWGERDDC